ncbi:MAG: general secretion pathway protein GspB [Gammaproteobacteria bacterium]|jgi:general secretion pathway protein B
MSYILEALKKSERDRALGQVPSLGAEQVAVREAPPVTRWVLGAFMVLVGLSGGILLARFEIGDSHRSPVEAVPPAAAIVPQARPGAASPAASQAPASMAARPRQPAPPRDVVASRSASPPRQPAAAVPPVEQTPTLPAPVPGASANALSSTQHPGPPPAAAAVSAAPPSTPPVSVSNVAKAHAAPPPPATPASSGASEKASTTVASSAPAAPVTPVEVPLLRDLPANVRQGLPALHVDVHVYARNPARRFVLINMHRYREGDTLAAGPRLLRITQGGVVLEYHGVRFRLGSG